MAKKTTRRRRKKSAKVNSRNITNKFVVSCTFLVLLFLLVVGFSYYLFGDKYLKFGINHNTVNNISFNDLFSSDTILIKNIKQLSDKKGKRSKAIELNISGDSNLEYEIILVPVSVDVDFKDIKYYLTDENDNFLKSDNLGTSILSNDYSGHIIYSGVLNNSEEKLKLRIWINEKINKDIKYNSFEVKVKLK